MEFLAVVGGGLCLGIYTGTKNDGTLLVSVFRAVILTVGVMLIASAF